MHSFSVRNVACLIAEACQGSNRNKHAHGYSCLMRPVTEHDKEHVFLHLLENTGFCYQRENLPTMMCVNDRSPTEEWDKGTEPRPKGSTGSIHISYSSMRRTGVWE